jgi:hypothetical protein
MGQSEEPVPIRWARPDPGLDVDRLAEQHLDRDLRELCDSGRGLPPTLAREVLFWLDLGRSPRDVARWLRVELESGPDEARFLLSPLHDSLSAHDMSTVQAPRGTDLAAVEQVEMFPSQSGAGETDLDAVVVSIKKRKRRVRRIFGRRAVS